MASLTITRSVKGKRASRGQLLGFDFRRPFDALWALFGSLRLLIVLLSSILVLSTIGVFISQAPNEVISSPSDYAAWVAANAQPQYHQFTSLMDWLGLFIIFRTWYFKVLILLLALNILVGGMLNRAPGIWHKFRHMQRQRADGFYENSPVRVGLTVGDDAAPTEATEARLRGFFAKRGFRVETAPRATDAKSYLYIHKYGWSALSTFVFHTCLIGIMLCAVLTGWGGFGQGSMAERVLPTQVYHYFQDLAGFSYDQPLPNGEQGVVYPMGTAHNIIYRAVQFTMTVDEKRFTPTDFYTDIQLYQDGKMVDAKRIRVNDPLTYQGVTFHQASFMMYTNIQLRDDKGNVIYSGAIPLTDHRTTAPDPNTGNVFQTNSVSDVPIPNYNETMNLAATRLSNGSWLVGVRGFDGAGKQLFQGAANYGFSCVTPDGTQFVAGSDYGCKLSNGWWMNINTVSRGTVLLITKDAGSPLLWPILALLVLSMWITFGFPPRRYWARVEGSQVRLAALKEHFVNQQRELDAYARALGNRALRATPTVAPEVDARPTPKRREKQPATV